MIEPIQNRRIIPLPGTLVNQIAAGEVIERPASVVKELVENCMDADAGRIEIDIDGGGLDKILVRDNGSGIHPDDIRLAVMRHTTSKLRTCEELETVMSLGFRGEALSSIASVSNFSITSRMETEAHGWKLDMKNQTDEPAFVPAAHPTGTTVVIRNLFHTVPARRKFLRSERTEFLHILEIVKRLVMSRFEIEISLQHNGKMVLTSPAIESGYQARIKSVMGGGFYNDAREIDASNGSMHLWGWLGGEKSARSQSDRQYLYLNNRVIRDRQLNHAIRLALETLIPDSRYPSYILHLVLDPAAVDVNVHPAKHEVRFRHARDVHDFVYAALRANLKSAAGSAMARYKPVGSQTDNFPAVDKALTQYKPAANYAVADNTIDSVPDDRLDPFGVPMAVLHDYYVLTLHGDGPGLINFRKLRYQYLYSRLRQDYSDNNIRQRPLLVPVILKLSPSVLSLLLSHQHLLARMGLSLDASGPQSVIIRGFPALLPDLDLHGLLAQLVNKLAVSNSTQGGAEELVLNLLAAHGSDESLEQVSLEIIRQELRQMAASGQSSNGTNLPGIWRRLSSTDLQNLIDG